MRDLTTPTHPSSDFLAHLEAEQTEFIRQYPARSLPSSFGAPSSWRLSIESAIAQLQAEITGLSRTIHANPEIGLSEFTAQASVGEILKHHGIAYTTSDFGIETSLRAAIGASAASPTIAILCEYDALPEIGHACGHNVMCAQSVGAFLALAQLDKALGLPGRVVLQTTPAEENASGKEIMAQNGMLAGIDAAIMCHSYGYDLEDQVWLGVRNFKVCYQGIPAHASAAPFMGRNALDAGVLALEGLGLLRQQLPPSDRVHAVITSGGQAVNIIPQRCELDVRIRSQHIDTLQDLTRRVNEVFTGAALMTGTGVSIEPDKAHCELPVRTNRTLLESWKRAMIQRGRPPLPRGAVSAVLAAATDFGNISVRVPGIHPLVAVGGPELMLHTKEMAAASGSVSGDTAAVDGAFALAMVAADFLYDQDFRSQVQQEFNQQGGALDPTQLFEDN